MPPAAPLVPGKKPSSTVTLRLDPKGVSSAACAGGCSAMEHPKHFCKCSRPRQPGQQAPHRQAVAGDKTPLANRPKRTSRALPEERDVFGSSGIRMDSASSSVVTACCVRHASSSGHALEDGEELLSSWRWMVQSCLAAVALGTKRTKDTSLPAEHHHSKADMSPHTQQTEILSSPP